MIYFVATRSKALGSKVIEWGTRDLAPDLIPCSHLAIIIDKKIVIDSTFGKGVSISPYSHWKTKYDVVYAFQAPYTGSYSYFISNIFNTMWNKKYDYMGILYFSWRILLMKLFKKKLPTKNKLQVPGKFFCVEIFGDKLGMMSPIQMVKKWLETPTMRVIKWDG